MTRADLTGMAILGGLSTGWQVLNNAFQIPVFLGLVFVDYANGRGGLTGAHYGIFDVALGVAALLASLSATILLWIWSKRRAEVAEDVPAIKVLPSLICCVCIAFSTGYLISFYRVSIVVAGILGVVLGGLTFMWMKSNFEQQSKSCVVLVALNFAALKYGYRKRTEGRAPILVSSTLKEVAECNRGVEDPRLESREILDPDRGRRMMSCLGDYVCLGQSFTDDSTDEFNDFFD